VQNVPATRGDPGKTRPRPVRFNVDQSRLVQIEQLGHLQLFDTVRVRALTAKRTCMTLFVVHAHFRFQTRFAHQVVTAVHEIALGKGQR
jgi:hypothetical protein